MRQSRKCLSCSHLGPRVHLLVKAMYTNTELCLKMLLDAHMTVLDPSQAIVVQPQDNVSG